MNIDFNQFCNFIACVARDCKNMEPENKKVLDVLADLCEQRPDNAPQYMDIVDRTMSNASMVYSDEDIDIILSETYSDELKRLGIVSSDGEYEDEAYNALIKLISHKVKWENVEEQMISAGNTVIEQECDNQLRRISQCLEAEKLPSISELLVQVDRSKITPDSRILVSEEGDGDGFNVFLDLDYVVNEENVAVEWQTLCRRLNCNNHNRVFERFGNIAAELGKELNINRVEFQPNKK